MLLAIRRVGEASVTSRELALERLFPCGRRVVSARRVSTQETDRRRERESVRERHTNMRHCACLRGKIAKLMQGINSLITRPSCCLIPLELPTSPAVAVSFPDTRSPHQLLDCKLAFSCLRPLERKREREDAADRTASVRETKPNEAKGN